MPLFSPGCVYVCRRLWLVDHVCIHAASVISGPLAVGLYVCSRWPGMCVHVCPGWV